MVSLTIPPSYPTAPKTRSGSVRVGKRNGNFPLSPSNGRHFPGGCSRACFVLRFSCYLFRSCSSPPPMSVPFCTSQSLTTGARETTRCQTCTSNQVGWMAKTEQTVSGPTPSCLPLTCGYSRRCVMYRRERTSVAVMNRNKINKTKSRGRLRSLSVMELL